MRRSDTIEPRTASRVDAAGRLQALDGLRGLAVAIVVASHLSNHRMLGNTGMALAGTGKSGVYLFFVLSAFLLTRLLLSMPPAGLRQPDTWIDYALRRVLRIWPLYLLVLLSSWVLGPHLPAWHYRIDTPTLLRHLTLQEGQSVLWSIPVEFKAYLVLPLIVAAVTLLRRFPAIVTAAMFIVSFVLACMFWPTSRMAVNSVALGPYLTAFIAGAGVAWLDLQWRARGGPSRAATIVCGAWVLAALGIWWFTTPLGLSVLRGAAVPADVNHGWIPFFALLWSSALLALLHAGPRVEALFANRPLRALGWISFSMYLWHMVVIDFWKAAGWPTGPLPAVTLVACMVLVAAASYRLVERPLQGIRWRPKRRSPTVSAAN